MLPPSDKPEVEKGKGGKGAKSQGKGSKGKHKDGKGAAAAMWHPLPPSAEVENVHTN